MPLRDVVPVAKFEAKACGDVATTTPALRSVVVRMPVFRFVALRSHAPPAEARMRDGLVTVIVCVARVEGPQPVTVGAAFVVSPNVGPGGPTSPLAPAPPVAPWAPVAPIAPDAPRAPLRPLRADLLRSLRPMLPSLICAP